MNEKGTRRYITVRSGEHSFSRTNVTFLILVWHSKFSRGWHTTDINVQITNK